MTVIVNEFIKCSPIFGGKPETLTTFHEVLKMHVE